MRRVLLATDFSANADHAIGPALHLARSLGAQLSILHAYPPHATRPENSQEASATLMHALVERIRNEHEFEALEPVIEAGQPLEVVEAFGQANTVDVIVMGTRGRDQAQSAMGSNTARLMSQGHIPVLAVPPRARFKGVQRVLLADDLRTVDALALLQLLNFVRLFQAKLHILHVSEALERHAQFSLEMALNNLDALTGRTEAFSHSILVGDDPLFTMDSYVTERDVDLLAVTLRKRTITDRLFGRGKNPKLAIHDTVPLLAFRCLG